MILLMEQVPNNHLGWCQCPGNNVKKYKYLSTSAGFLPIKVILGRLRYMYVQNVWIG